MARYIDADALLSKMPDDLPYKASVKRVLMQAPEADVVPKSEVVSILDELMKEAREVSDRYKKSADETSDFEFERIEFRGCQIGSLLVLFKIAELKKKYTEGKQ